MTITPTRPVRGISACRPVLLLACVLLACDEEPLTSLGTLGNLTIQLVSEESPAAAREAGEPGVRASPAEPLSHLDSVKVTVTGPATATVKLTQGASGFTGTVSNLTPGTYTVVVTGYDANEVDYYGSSGNVTVVAGQTATATIPWGSFVPSPAALPASTAQFRFAVQWTAVAGADSYKVEIDKSSAFSSVTRTNVTTASTALTVTDTGTYYVRVRSSNPRVALGRPSGTQTVQVVANPAEPADNSFGSATALGFGVGASGTFGGLNIYPAGDVDFFSLGLCQGDSINLTAKAVRLTPPSPLNSGLQLYTPENTIVAANNDADSTDARHGARVDREGNFRIRVSSGSSVAAGGVGHYELIVQVVAGPDQGATSCGSGTNVAQVQVTPASFATTSLGATQSFGTQAKDAAGNTISGKTPTWFSLNPGVAAIDPTTGVASVVASGQTSIAATIDGVAGYAMIQASGSGAQTVASWGTLATGTSGALNAVWGFSPNETFYAVGAGGTVRRMVDGLWSSGFSPTTRDLYGVYGFTPTDAFAVGAGGAIVRIGASGSRAMASGTTQHLYGVWGSSPTSVYA
ncbi:MAG: hypothetical protein HY560_11590, partial [Gemmatimonadetes bacterium]|nr:hypothetical protein [Gemmatimonadota bacterium]